MRNASRSRLNILLYDTNRMITLAKFLLWIFWILHSLNFFEIFWYSLLLKLRTSWCLRLSRRSPSEINITSTTLYLLIYININIHNRVGVWNSFVKNGRLLIFLLSARTALNLAGLSGDTVVRWYGIQRINNIVGSGWRFILKPIS